MRITQACSDTSWMDVQGTGSGLASTPGQNEVRQSEGLFIHPRGPQGNFLPLIPSPYTSFLPDANLIANRSWSVFAKRLQPGTAFHFWSQLISNIAEPGRISRPTTPRCIGICKPQGQWYQHAVDSATVNNGRSSTATHLATSAYEYTDTAEYLASQWESLRDSRLSSSQTNGFPFCHLAPKLPIFDLNARTERRLGEDARE